MPTYSDKKFINDEGLVVSASQWHILERRKRVAVLYRELLPKYNKRKRSFMQMYYHIAQILKEEGFESSEYTILNDMKVMGIVTPNQRKKRRALKKRKE